MLVQSPDLPVAPPCSSEVVRQLATPSDQPFRLTCRAVLNGTEVRRPVLLEGAEASGAGLDCGRCRRTVRAIIEAARTDCPVHKAG